MIRRTVYDTKKLNTLLTVVCFTFTYVTESMGSGVRPENTFLEVLGQPFVPTDAASAECLRDSAIYITALGNYTPWALQMYDASAKIPSGVITGNIRQLGNYDECLRITNSHNFIGQACTASVRFDVHKDAVFSNETDLKDLLTNVAWASGLKNWTSGNTVAYEWTWCVPSTCTYAEIREKVDVSLDPLRVEGRIDMNVIMTENSCHTAKTDVRIWNAADWNYVTLLILFAVITIVSTTIDLMTQKKYQEKRKDTKQIVLTSFSLYSNGKALLNTERRGDSIGCLDGIRYISICWIIYGHTHYLQVVGVQLDVSHVPVMHESWASFLVLNGNIVTDTFFLLSGLLLAYTKYSQKQSNPTGTTLNLFELYVRRYFRLTPAYAMIIGFYATIYYKLGTGPEWDTWVGSNRDYCRENWWTNLLYVNNVVNVERMCMSQTWYLAVDMQFVWLSPIFLYPMLKFSRAMIFWVILGIGLVASIAVPFIITWLMGLTGTMIYYRDPVAVAQVFLQIYTRSYTRAGPYIVGLGMGYMLSKIKSLSIKIPRIYAIAGWIFAAVLLGTSVFGPRGMYYEDHVYNRVEASFYAGFHRTTFVLALSWIIFACVHGIAGPINGFLAWSGWMPLSRLTYSAYLCHYIVLTYNSGIVRTPGNMTSYTVVHAFLGNLVLVMLISTIVTLIFEMPFMVLDNALRQSRRRQSDSKDNVPPLSKMDNENEVYKTIEDSVSSVSQIYTDIADIVRAGDGSYVTNVAASSGYYVDQVERAVKNENIYTYIIGSRINTPQPERRYDYDSREKIISGSMDNRFDSSEEILSSIETTPKNPSEGVDNKGYQV